MYEGPGVERERSCNATERGYRSFDEVVRRAEEAGEPKPWKYLPAKCMLELSERPWFMVDDPELQEWAREAFTRAGRGMSRGLSFRCWQCGSWNHTYKWCVFGGLRNCHVCKLFGHFAGNCPNESLMRERVLPKWEPMQADFTPGSPAGNR